MTTNVFYFDQSGFENRLMKITSGAEKLQELLTESNNLDLVKIKSIEELVKLSEAGGESYIKSQIGKDLEPQKIFGITVSRRKAVELLELPDMDKLSHLARECQPYNAEVKHYTLKNGKVIIDQKEVESTRNQYTVIASTPEQIQLLDSHKKSAAALTEFNKSLSEVLQKEIHPDTAIKEYFIILDSVNVNDFFYGANKEGLFKNANKKE
jgi:hypothetical protein